MAHGKITGNAIPRAEAPSRVVRVRMSPAEIALAERAARLNQQSFSAFVRDSALIAAGDCLEDLEEAS